MTNAERLAVARRFLTEGRYVACLRLVGPLTERAPRTKEDLEAQRLLARAGYALGQMRVVEQAARRVVRRRPKDAATMTLLVRSLNRQGRFAEAAQWMTKLDDLGTDTWDGSAPPKPVVKQSRSPHAA